MSPVKFACAHGIWFVFSYHFVSTMANSNKKHVDKKI